VLPVTIFSVIILLVPRVTIAQPLALTNPEVPFCYQDGGSNQWPIMGSRKALENSNDRILVRLGDQETRHSLPVQYGGLRIDIRDGQLIVAAEPNTRLAMAVHLEVHRGTTVLQRQSIRLQPAPPNCRISYLSDLVDDLIRVFWDGSKREFRPLAKHHFDAYFRRLQCHGIQRLIVWQSPFPLTTNPDNYATADWERYCRQARAIIDSNELTQGMRQSGKIKSYDWLRFLMAMRMEPNFGRWYTASAEEHGIRLTASFRPFEMALMKYYQVPAFGEDGSYLWQFLPQASPAVNYHAEDVGFAQFRQVIRQLGVPDAATPRILEIGQMKDAAEIVRRHQDGREDLALYAASSPPLDDSSYVLVEDSSRRFQLKKYGEIATQVRSKWTRLKFRMRLAAAGRLVIELPSIGDSRFLIINAMSDVGAAFQWPVVHDLQLFTAKGNRLGRINVSISVKGTSEAARATRVSGIPADGMFRTDFQAIENSVDYFRESKRRIWTMERAELVIDLGEPWSTEMVDFERAAARRFAVRQLKTILAHDAFDEILLNTRSHTQLGGSTADGEDGPQTLAHYRLNGRRYQHYGSDLAYAPLSIARTEAIGRLARDGKSLNHISDWQSGEWQNPCQDPTTPFIWRYARNRAIARGIRDLLLALEVEFPNTRIRAVIPHSAAVEQWVRRRLVTLNNAQGKPYGADYFRHIWGSGNSIPAIGEGMAMVSLDGLRTEPVYLGIRHLPEPEPLSIFLAACAEDLRENRGSSFRGARSIVYEAQATLRHQDKEMARRRRQQILRRLLDDETINEVLLYESIDWLYAFPLDENVYQFLGR
jgi:hypothetical protein